MKISTLLHLKSTLIWNYRNSKSIGGLYVQNSYNLPTNVFTFCFYSQEDENLMVHLLGAFFCFAFGVAYCLQHSWLSFKTSPEFSPPWICFLRLCLTTSAAVMLALGILFIKIYTFYTSASTQTVWVQQWFIQDFMSGGILLTDPPPPNIISGHPNTQVEKHVNSKYITLKEHVPIFSLILQAKITN